MFRSGNAMSPKIELQFFVKEICILKVVLRDPLTVHFVPSTYILNKFNFSVSNIIPVKETGLFIFLHVIILRVEDTLAF